MKTLTASVLLVVMAFAVTAEAGKKKARKFYLSQERVTATQVLTACDEHYHMASIWEILDVSSLRYNTELGVTHADSGEGPPVGGEESIGWIRTGFFGLNANVPGSNCVAWTTEQTGVLGTVVSLGWGTEAQRLSPWSTGVAPCTDQFSVWCVED